MRVLVVALILAGCSGAEPAARVRAEGTSIVLDADRPLRALLVEVGWTGDAPPTFTAGADAEGLNLVRAVVVEPGRSRVLVTDTRRLRLPRRGAVLEAGAEVTILAASAADDGGAPVEVEAR